MAKKKINSGYMTQTIDLESRILKYFPTDYKYFFNTPLFGTNDFANSNTYITNPDIEQQLDSFFCSSENLLSVFNCSENLWRPLLFFAILFFQFNNKFGGDFLC